MSEPDRPSTVEEVDVHNDKATSNGKPFWLTAVLVGLVYGAVDVALLNTAGVDPTIAKAVLAGLWVGVIALLYRQTQPLGPRRQRLLRTLLGWLVFTVVSTIVTFVIAGALLVSALSNGN
jgi:hypothetical protein